MLVLFLQRQRKARGGKNLLRLLLTVLVIWSQLCFIEIFQSWLYCHNSMIDCLGSPELDEPPAWHIGQLRFCQGWDLPRAREWSTRSTGAIDTDVFCWKCPHIYVGTLNKRWQIWQHPPIPLPGPRWRWDAKKRSFCWAAAGTQYRIEIHSRR